VRNDDLLALLRVVELELEVERDGIFDGVVLNAFTLTKVEGYLSSTEPKSIILGKMLRRSGKVGYA
jgi:hypothetical protein